MVAATSETLAIFCQTAQHNSSEDGHLNGLHSLAHVADMFMFGCLFETVKSLSRVVIVIS